MVWKRTPPEPGGGEETVMSIYIASSLFALIILVYWVISELFTMLFRFTGLPDERARFQVVSLLTGCGFTTRESELILTTRSRRRLARITMLFGYVFNITIVSAFVNVFLSLKLVQVENYIGAVLIPLAAVIAVLAAVRIRFIRTRCDRLIEKLIGKFMHTDSVNTVMLIDYIGSDSIAVVTLNDIPDDLRDKPLRDTGLKTDKKILVMLIEKKNRKAAPADAETVFEKGDKLTVFGRYSDVCKAFSAKEQFAQE